MEYFNSMDRDFYNLDQQEDAYVNFGDIGLSTNESNQLGGPYHIQLGVGGKLRTGTNHIELNMGGYGNEPGGAATYGSEARQAIREIAQSNKVDYTVHAPVNMKGVNGYTQNGYSVAQEKEIERSIHNTIDFAADIGSSGAIVLHAGEDTRDVNFIPNSKGKVDGQEYEFSNYFSDREIMVDQVVDRRSGHFISEGGIRADEKIILPYFKTDDNKLVQLTPEGEKISNINVIDLKSKNKDGSVINKKIPMIDFNDVSNLINFSNAIPVDENGELQTQEVTYKDIKKFTDEYNKRNNEHHNATEIFAKLKYRDNIKNSIDEYKLRYHEYNKYKKQWDRLMQAKEAYNEFYPNLDERDKKVFDILENDFQQVLPSQRTNPIEFINEKEKELRFQMNRYKDEVVKSKEQYENIREILNNLDSGNKYAREKSISKYADYGIYTMQRSQDSNYTETKENPNNLFIALENIFPEWGYGSHPDEFVELVEKSRKKMAEKLTSKELETYDRNGVKNVEKNPYYNPNITKEDAKKIAEKYIKATLDFQHLGMWKKYFKPIYLENKKRQETKEETEQRFNKWYMQQIKKIEKSNVLGHLHIADSVDESHQHLPAGQGNLPIKTAINYLIKNGYDTNKYKLLSEGFQDDMYLGQQRGTYATYRYLNPTASVTDVTSLSFMNVADSVPNYSGSSNYMTPNYMAPLKRENWSGWYDFRGL